MAVTANSMQSPQRLAAAVAGLLGADCQRLAALVAAVVITLHSLEALEQQGKATPEVAVLVAPLAVAAAAVLLEMPEHHRRPVMAVLVLLVRSRQQPPTMQAAAAAARATRTELLLVAGAAAVAEMECTILARQQQLQGRLTPAAVAAAALLMALCLCQARAAAAASSSFAISHKGRYEHH